MITRRNLLKASAAAWVGSRFGLAADNSTLVNDIHSQLNETQVERIITPRSVRDVQGAVREAKTTQRSISIAGGRHAMGGQQFGSGSALLDMRQMNRVLDFDAVRGLLE